MLHASMLRPRKCETRLQVTPQIKIQRGEIGARRRPLHRPSTSYPMTRELPVQQLSYADAMVPDLSDILH
jgi:hypothetical protein